MTGSLVRIHIKQTSLNPGSTWCCTHYCIHFIENKRLITTGKVPGNYLLGNYSFFNYQSTCNSILTLNKQNPTLDLRNYKKFHQAIWSPISSLHFLGKDYSGIFKSMFFCCASKNICHLFIGLPSVSSCLSKCSNCKILSLHIYLKMCIKVQRKGLDMNIVFIWAGGNLFK